MKRYARILLIGASLLLAACSDGSDDDKVSSQGCSVQQQNRYVHEVMKEYYLWYEQVDRVIDYADFISPQLVLDYLRYDQYDAPGGFSYLTTESSFQSLYDEGQYLGFGFSSETDQSGRVWVRFVYRDSPAGREGMQRGDEILSVTVNGQTQVLTNITGNPDWRDIFGPDEEEGYEIEMTLAKSSGGNVTIQMSKTTVDINTVLHSEVINSGGKTTGYLVFNSFLSTSNAELSTVFQQFASAGVNRVILDLRYNSGGRVDVANNLASYLYKANNSTSLFNQLRYNDRNQADNTNYYLNENQDYALKPDQLIVITTGQTCSASEMIINGLAPYLPVKTVGSTTCGKPVGMNAFFFCEKALLPVTFAIENKNGAGGYYSGIDADCAASDDIDFSFGDSMFKGLKVIKLMNDGYFCGILC